MDLDVEVRGGADVSSVTVAIVELELLVVGLDVGSSSGELRAGGVVVSLGSLVEGSDSGFDIVFTGSFELVEFMGGSKVVVRLVGLAGLSVVIGFAVVEGSGSSDVAVGFSVDSVGASVVVDSSVAVASGFSEVTVGSSVGSLLSAPSMFVEVCVLASSVSLLIELQKSVALSFKIGIVTS